MNRFKMLPQWSLTVMLLTGTLLISSCNLSSDNRLDKGLPNYELQAFLPEEHAGFTSGKNGRFQIYMEYSYSSEGILVKVLEKDHGYIYSVFSIVTHKSLGKGHYIGVATNETKPGYIYYLLFSFQNKNQFTWYKDDLRYSTHIDSQEELLSRAKRTFTTQKGIVFKRVTATEAIEIDRAVNEQRALQARQKYEKAKTSLERLKRFSKNLPTTNRTEQQTLDDA